MKKLVSVLLALALVLGMAGAFAESEDLPAYTWNGDDPVWGAVVKYFQENDFGYEPAEGGVLIPTPIVLKMEKNEDETKATVWGNFWIFTYSRNAENPKILDRGPCGENPGVLKLEKKDDEWAVVSADLMEDGDDYKEKISEYCAGDKDLEAQYYLTTGSSDDSILDQYQRAAVVNYVVDNSLDIEAYQEPGWGSVNVIN